MHVTHVRILEDEIAARPRSDDPPPPHFRQRVRPRFHGRAQSRHDASTSTIRLERRCLTVTKRHVHCLHPLKFEVRARVARPTARLRAACPRNRVNPRGIASGVSGCGRTSDGTSGRSRTETFCYGETVTEAGRSDRGCRAPGSRTMTRPVIPAAPGRTHDHATHGCGRTRALSPPRPRARSRVGVRRGDARDRRTPASRAST